MTALKGWKVARIRGVDLKIHISLLFLLLYIVFVASMQFPLVVRQSGIDPAFVSWNPGIWGFVFAFALFLSVAIHEFGHVFVAQALGVKVQGVTLMMLGGVSEMEKVPERKFAEFKLSVIGPIVSLGIAAVLFTVERYSIWPNVTLFSFWLGRVNLILAIFNLLPAFPLDGGRALRSLLASRQGMVKATQNAVAVSKTLAWILGILGFMSFNILLMLIAFFIYTTANSELFLLLSRDVLKDVTANEVGLRTPLLEESDSLTHAAQVMLTSRHRLLPVNGIGVTGLVSVNELRRIAPERWSDVTVKQVMEVAKQSIDTAERVDSILPDLASSRMGAFPLKENGKIVGLVRYSDLTDALQLRSLEVPKETPSKKRAA